MLAVLLTVLSVLKIIGIVLLCILAFVLFVLILVLFVPVRYRIDALIPETDLDEGFDVEKTDVRAKFSWLLFVIRGGISFPRDKAFTLRVFGIKILPKKGKAEKDEKAGKADKTGKVEKADNAEKDEKEADGKEAGNSKNEDKKESLGGDAEKEPGGETSGDGDEKDSHGEGAESKSGGETSGDGGDAGSGEGAESKPGGTATGDGDENVSHGDGFDASGEGGSDADLDEEESSFLDVLWRIFDGIDNFLKTPLNVFEKIQYTISRVCDKIDMIKSTLENDIFKRAFELVKKKLIRIIRMILPDKCDIDVMFGSGDPATTAEILAAYSALYPILFNKVRFRPDFERKAVCADAHIKGHITLFTIVWSAAVCYFNKDVKKTIRRFKKIMNS